MKALALPRLSSGPILLDKVAPGITGNQERFMRLRRVGRLGTTGAMVAAALGASIVFTPSPASAASDDWKCYGTQVKRCVTVRWDQTVDTFEGLAKITDVAGGVSYEVKVIDVKLLRTSNADWLTVRSRDDHDGWHDTEDVAGTATIDPCTFPRSSFSVAATFSWRNASSSGETTWRPNHSWGFLCD
ncbi:hypothetical protein ACQEVC_42505 [Plantactinospora sp. CA-294935]|uniref:hypothetical protein n=1 Tax=Plantactinospora sp. CA-294935 TaxID=3240012 RepID=UPI003D909D07